MIRQARESDFEEIITLRKTLAIEIDNLSNQTYRLSVQKSGFLLKKPYPKEEYIKDLQKTFLVANKNEQILGYSRIDEKQEMDKEDIALWYNPNLEKEYFSLPHRSINAIGVLPHVKRQGIATSLLNRIIEEITKEQIPYVYSSVIISPITNLPSLLFHEKHGFDRIALISEPEVYGMKNFSSVLYRKTLL